MTINLLAALAIYVALGGLIALCTGAAAVRQWLTELFIVLDQLANVLVTPFHSGAWADETLSCRAYRAWKDGRWWGRIWMPVIDLLFKWQKLSPGAIGHCHGAYLHERARYNAPPELR